MFGKKKLGTVRLSYTLGENETIHVGDEVRLDNIGLVGVVGRVVSQGKNGKAVVFIKEVSLKE